MCEILTDMFSLIIIVTNLKILNEKNQVVSG